MRSLVARLRVVNRELHEAEGKLDKLCMAISETAAEAGDCLRRQDVMILKSMPGIGRIKLAARSAKARGLSAAGITQPSGHCVALHR